MDIALHIFTLTSPLFLLVLLGYALSRWLGWPRAASAALTRFVFGVALPAFLFRLMSDFAKLPHVDARLLVAYFGGAVLVYLLGRVLARQVFGLDGVGQSVFGVGSVFSNNVLLGIPMAQMTLPARALPSVSLVVVFNALLLWTLVSLSVEWARNRDLSLAGFGKTARGVVLNPIVASILLGTAWGFTGLQLPTVAGRTLELVSVSAVPMSLVALGMGLAEYGIRAGLGVSAAMTVLKVAVMPAVVFGLARALSLPPSETAAVVLLAALPTGANVYLMAREFNSIEGPVASALVISTMAASVTTPLVLAVLGMTA